MQRAGDDLFAAARFTCDYDCGRTLRNALNLGHEVADHRAMEHGCDAKQDLGFGQLRHSGALYLNVNGQRITSYVGFSRNFVCRSDLQYFQELSLVKIEMQLPAAKVTK